MNGTKIFACFLAAAGLGTFLGHVLPESAPAGTCEPVHLQSDWTWHVTDSGIGYWQGSSGHVVGYARSFDQPIWNRHDCL